ncbi:hypothetical protein OIU78_003800 [Salix suchowensis]|nr:hypothetical protein OIU78_003800 [Salix suchowensis]
MVETQVTTMVIKVVDLGCEKCNKKIKKILCKIPQIQNQIHVEEKNTVTITVVCCFPEKIKKKILRKGCGFIECVEIKPPSPPPETKPNSPKPTPPETKPISPKPTPPIKHEVSCGPWCDCHSKPPRPCWVPYSRPPCIPWEDGFCSCRRRGYLVCICEDYSSSCTII